MALADSAHELSEPDQGTALPCAPRAVLVLCGSCQASVNPRQSMTAHRHKGWAAGVHAGPAARVVPLERRRPGPRMPTRFDPIRSRTWGRSR